MDIKPGLNVRIVTDVDLARERISVKASTVYDVKGQTAILAQTDPPILKSMLNKEITITYLVRKNDAMVRYGFLAKIVEFIDYSLEAGKMVKALEVDGITEAQPYNIRMSYRVTPTVQDGLTMAINGTPINVLDFSLGGAKLSCDRSVKLKMDSVVSSSIEMGGRTYSVKARVIRSWDGQSEGFSQNLRFASIEFVNMDRTIEQALSQKIQDIERQSFQRETDSQPSRPPV
jgi:PilZ domain